MATNPIFIETTSACASTNLPMIANHSHGTRRLKAILLADVVGYSELMGEDEAATSSAIKRQMQELDKLSTPYQGEVVEIIGDGIFLTFDSVVDAVRYAIEAQKVIERINTELPQQNAIRFRMGINLGDVIVDGERYYGDSINIASRIEALAEPGGISITGTVYEQIRNKLRYGYEYMGPQQLKNIRDPVDVFKIREEVAGVDRIPSHRVVTHGIDIQRALPARPSVVVLPLENMSESPDEEYFSDGITEDITTNLSKFHELFVIARSSAFTYKGKAASPTQIRQDLGVRYLVQGSIRRVKDRVRVSIQLVDSESGHNVWAEQFNRSLDDIFAVQDEITEIVASCMAVNIETAESEKLMQSIPQDLHAYGLVLRGQQHLFRYTQNDNRAARGLYEQALKSDPLYARAIAAASRTLNIDWRYSWTDSPETILDKALKMAMQAVSLDRSDARAHGELGFVQLYRKENDNAIRSYERAVRLNPNDADILSDMGDALAHSGQSAIAIEMLKRAMRLNPYYPDQYLWHLGGAYYNLKEYEEAIDSVLRMNNPTEGARILAASYAQLGQQKEAQLYADKVVEAHPEFSIKKWASVQPDKLPEETERFMEGLRKAGLE